MGLLGILAGPFLLAILALVAVIVLGSVLGSF
jgi:hypothetical protein